MDFQSAPTPAGSPRRGAARAVLPPLLAGAALLAACTSTRPPFPEPSIGRPIQSGTASWYGGKFHGRHTASGERYDMHAMTAAHLTLPFGTLVEVRNPRNGRSVVVRINDRGPFAKQRVIDLSYAAATELGLVGPGTGWVELYAASDPPLQPHFTVQVGAFTQAALANDLHRGLRRQYPEAVLRSDGAWHRVQVGSFDERAKAEVLKRELASFGFVPVVVQVP